MTGAEPSTKKLALESSVAPAHAEPVNSAGAVSGHPAVELGRSGAEIRVNSSQLQRWARQLPQHTKKRSITVSADHRFTCSKCGRRERRRDTLEAKACLGSVTDDLHSERAARS